MAPQLNGYTVLVPDAGYVPQAESPEVMALVAQQRRKVVVKGRLPVYYLGLTWQAICWRQRAGKARCAPWGVEDSQGLP